MKPIEELNISPWPWKNHGVEYKSFGFVRVRDKDGFFVADAEGESDDNARANGDLIAAAPKMYDALREAVEHICRDCVHHVAKIDGDKLKDEECMLREPCRAHEWRAALSEASGEVVQ